MHGLLLTPVLYTTKFGQYLLVCTIHRTRLSVCTEKADYMYVLYTCPKNILSFCPPLLMQGCEFKCSLLRDGSLCTVTGNHYKGPNQWVHSCWAQLGQQKHSIKTKSAYKNVR